MALPKSLLDRLAQRKVIPFVGAGLSMSVGKTDGSQLFPSWSTLLRNSASALRDENKEVQANLVEALVENDELYQAAQRAKDALGARWYDFLKTVFDRVLEDADVETLRVNELIWKLGSNLIVTTNYDRTLQWTCPNRADFRVWDIEAKVEQIASIRDGDARRPTVWHLHGHIDNAAELILTPDGYAKLYGEGTSEEVYTAALDVLRSFLKSHSFVFVGFSLRDAKFLQELTKIDERFDRAASQHYILLPRADANRPELRAAGVEIVPYENYGDLQNILTVMASQAENTPTIYLQSARYLVDKSQGIHIFGGRGDAFFRLYDSAIDGLRNELDIFSLKLSRFRQRHGKELLKLCQTTRIRLAILDPSFPLASDEFSIASIRDREEKAIQGAIMRDVAAWCDLYDEYQTAVSEGTIKVDDGKGLHIHLYNAIPTINIFRADSSLFVGPYLLDVEDRSTPTFLIRGDAVDNSVGSELYKSYLRHFSAIWEAKTTRPIADVSLEDRRSWSSGAYATALAS